MSEAKGKFDWQQTSSLMAIVANIMRDPKKGKPASPDDFNPYLQKKKSQAVPKVDISILKELFVK